jgi:outer membrane receptor protein involved in Fe transport
MFIPPARARGLALALALACPVWPAVAAVADAASLAAATVDATTAVPAAATAALALQPVEITGTRRKLDAARNGLSPDTGSTIYRFDAQDIARLPLGDSTPLNQVLLQAPGAVQDSYGQLHVRGDHANLQYRIDGIVIPEAISGFGQALETRFADRISLLTGALPAQYGYRTAGVVDIQSKGTSLDNGGRVSLVSGSHAQREASAEYGGSQGALSYYLTGSLLRNELGIENPTPARSALHDRTEQGKGFGYLSYLLDATSRVNLLLGTADNRFQIPNVPGQTPSYSLTGAGPVDSATLDATQRETNRFAVVSYQSSVGDTVDYQVALFRRNTTVHYRPDIAGDLQFYGIAADVQRRNQAYGLQSDLSWKLDAAHTVRAGAFAQRERYGVANAAQVFPADAAGNQTSDVPFTVNDNTQLAGRLWGVYLQDEWKPALSFLPPKALTVNYGLRYDQVATVVDEQQLSPRLGAVYDLSDRTRLHAGYARYFTPPPTEKIDTTSVQKFLGTTNALPSDANTAVKSERSDYYDAGLSHQLTPQLTLGLDGYYRRVRHLQDEGQFGNALIYSAFNYNEGRIMGLELSATYRAHGLTAYGNLAYSRAMGRGIETGQFNFGADEQAYIASHWVHLDHDQRLSGSAGIGYRWPSSLQLSADVLYGSGLRRGFANTQSLPGYTQVNLAATREIDLGTGLGLVEGRLAVTNVLDTSYALRDGSGIGVGAPQYGPRRGLSVGVSKRF